MARIRIDVVVRERGRRTFRTLSLSKPSDATHEDITVQRGALLVEAARREILARTRKVTTVGTVTGCQHDDSGPQCWLQRPSWDHAR